MNQNLRCCLFIVMTIMLTPHTFLFAQSTLEAQLQGKQTLKEIMGVVDQHYRNHPEDPNEFESELLHWKRWERYMSGRLGPNDEFVHIPEMLLQATDEMKRMDPGPEERNINSYWNFIGPSTSPLQNEEAYFNGLGRVDRIVFHPTEEEVFYLCTPAGGLWSTADTGHTWHNLTDHLPSIGISGFIISHDNPSHMYLLTGDGDSFNHPLGYSRPSVGVLKSTDGGVSWHQTGTFPNSEEPYAGYVLVQSPANPDLLMAGTSNGLYRTTDGGATWIHEFGGRFYDIKFKPGDPTRVYAARKGEFLLSINSGDTWTGNATYDFDPSDCGPNNGGRISIAVAPSSPNTVYLLAGPKTGLGTFCGVYRSLDSGLSFTRQSNSPNVLGGADNGIDTIDQSGYDLALTCHPDFANTIYACGCTVWKSTNGGTSWIHVTSFREDGMFPYIHPDIHFIGYNPLNNFLYAASDGGVYVSKNHGGTWENLSANIETSMFYQLAGWDGNINKLMGGLQDNGVKYRQSNTSAFHHIDCCDGNDVIFNPVNGEPAYATINYGVSKYSSNGQYSFFSYPEENYYWFKTLATHNSDSSITFFGSYDIYKTDDSGENWSNKGGSGSWSMASCPSNSNRFYSSGDVSFLEGNGGVYFSGDIGETWTLKSENTGFPDPSNWNRINDVAVYPNNSSTVYACFGGFIAGYKVMKSTNTGDSWTNISANLPNVPVNCLAVDNDNGVYAGTDIGVFYRSATMNNWMPWSNALPNVPVTGLVIFDNGVTKRIRAATYGRGVWQSDLAATCDASVIVTGNIEGIRHYEASTSLSSTSSIQGGLGTFVSFQSGNYITLSEGFNVVDASEFLGFISPCGQGGIPSLQDNSDITRSNPNASIIPLRRMWDPADGLPYGSIDEIKTQKNIAQIKFRLKAAGKVQLYAAKQIQDNLITLYNSEQSGGLQYLEADTSQMEKEFYYLLLFYEGKLAHFQELDLR
ncbi:MAG TPA: hypothetical protein VLA46_02070 [Saprospiraceae bacterium]|nr:hypothetical protein [Saprospiraceae bacterium]